MSYPFSKRLFDLLGSGIGILVLLPIGLVIALLVKLSDGGPIFFGQIRVGQFGRPFRMWKFRSMVVNADKLGLLVTNGQDQRITPLGRWLRRTKLDELPQLWNVFLGDMSLVGPRPEVGRYVELYTPEQRQVLDCKPGITDRASLLFRNEEALLRGAADVEQFYVRYCLPRKIELNRQYAQQASLLRDIGVILQTLSALLLSAGGRALRLLHQSFSSPGAKCPASSRRVAIIGTGHAATQLARELADNAQCPGQVVAFFDDDPRRWHQRPHDIPVVGMPECLLKAEWRDQLDEVIVALPEQKSNRAQEIGAMLKALPLKTTFTSPEPQGSSARSLNGAMRDCSPFLSV